MKEGKEGLPPQGAGPAGRVPEYPPEARAMDLYLATGCVEVKWITPEEAERIWPRKSQAEGPERSEGT